MDMDGGPTLIIFHNVPQMVSSRVMRLSHTH